RTRNVTMAIYYRTKGSIISLKTLYRRTLKRGYATEHSHKATRKEAKRNAKNILNNTIPETIFYYAINSKLENLKTIEKNAVIKNTWKNLSPGMIVGSMLRQTQWDWVKLFILTTLLILPLVGF
ncbi:hypothetical protein, partial [Mycoplasma sp. 327]